MNVDPPNWGNDAACLQHDPDTCFPEVGETTYAKTICLGDPALGIPTCPIVDMCREFAIENREPWGVWGGTTSHDRRGIIKERMGGEAA